MNVSDYIKQEDTSFNLHNKIMPLENEKQNGILIEINGNNFNQNDLNYIQNISAIINDSGEVGTFNLGNLDITINNLQTYEKDLIICE
jgi:hypothetical protein